MNLTEHPVSQRIKIIIEKESAGKVVDFASKLSGIPYQVISRLFKMDVRNGKYPTPSTDLILEIINKFISYNPIWLLTGEGEMLKDDSVEKNNSNLIALPEVDEKFNEDYWRGRYDQLKEDYDRLFQELQYLKSTPAS